MGPSGLAQNYGGGLGTAGYPPCWKGLTLFPHRAHVSRGLLAMADASDALVRVCVMYA